MTASSESVPLSAVDSAWLRMEDPTNLMTITGIMTFDRPLEFARLKEVIEDRLMLHDRFRQRVVDPKRPFAKPRWKEDDQFALGAHLHRIGLPRPADQAALQEVVSDLMSRPLDFTKPLWQMHYVDNYQDGSALIARIHHCVGDGLSLLPVLLDMTDPSPEGPAPVDRAEADEAAGPEADQTGTTAGSETRGTPRTHLPPSHRSWAEILVEQGREVLDAPAKLMDMAVAGTDGALTLARMVAMPADPPSVFKGALNTEKKAAWSTPMDLERIKAAGRRLGGTINDVLMAAVAGALRRYLLDRQGEVPRPFDQRAVLPVNLRAPGDRSLGNRFGLVFLSLPVGESDPRTRLRVVHDRMHALKSSAEPIVSFAVLQAVGATTSSVEEMVLKLFGSKATAVATNVPGPREQLYFCGQRVRSIMFWVPQSGHLGLGISILSYAGTVRIGIATDRGLVPDPEALVDAYHQEIEALVALEAS